MRVLEHGNLKVRKCPECHCKFEFEEKDLHIKENIEAESKAINAPFLCSRLVD